MKHLQKVKKLAKFLDYLLGRRPDEFGLCPDEDGYVKVKDLIKALGEEDGWGYVRQSHLREVTATLERPPVELSGKQIRAVDRSKLIVPSFCDSVPKLLYHPVRQRAYPIVIEKGVIRSDSRPKIVLARERSMAERLGKRMDASPVILTVNTDKLTRLGAALNAFGSVLFLNRQASGGQFQRTAAAEKAPGNQSRRKIYTPGVTENAGKLYSGSFQRIGIEKKASEERPQTQE